MAGDDIDDNFCSIHDCRIAYVVSKRIYENTSIDVMMFSYSFVTRWEF